MFADYCREAGKIVAFSKYLPAGGLAPRFSGATPPKLLLANLSNIPVIYCESGFGLDTINPLFVYYEVNYFSFFPYGSYKIFDNYGNTL
jgi:hypothetical protein